ncbi:MAG: hypothetical protein FWH14_07980, partial [Oscillospiraceae bacterium]|nr:hypothetical protein [Oscillospiraceae bacterium]
FPPPPRGKLEIIVGKPHPPRGRGAAAAAGWSAVGCRRSGGCFSPTKIFFVDLIAIIGYNMTINGGVICAYKSFCNHEE